MKMSVASNDTTEPPSDQEGRRTPVISVHSNVSPNWLRAIELRIGRLDDRNHDRYISTMDSLQMDSLQEMQSQLLQ